MRWLHQRCGSLFSGRLGRRGRRSARTSQTGLMAGWAGAAVAFWFAWREAPRRGLLTGMGVPARAGPFQRRRLAPLDGRVPGCVRGGHGDDQAGRSCKPGNARPRLAAAGGDAELESADPHGGACGSCCGDNSCRGDAADPDRRRDDREPDFRPRRRAGGADIDRDRSSTSIRQLAIATDPVRPHLLWPRKAPADLPWLSHRSQDGKTAPG